MSNPSAILVALLVCGLLVLVMRWVFGSGRPRSRPPVDASEAELGLLTVVAQALPRNQAVQVQAKLRGAGVRSSVSRRHDGLADVLVFNDDADAAKALLQP